MECNPRTSYQGNVHVLLVPYPSQGHLAPSMKLGNQLANHGVKVTLMTLEFMHRKIEMVASCKLDGEEQELVRIVSVQDEVRDEDESELARSIEEVMPSHLEDFIKKANAEDNNEKITCVIIDVVLGWALEVAERMGLKTAIFFPSSPGALAMTLQIPKLIEAGIIDADDGTIIKDKKVLLSPNLPALDCADFAWNFPAQKSLQKIAFQFIFLVSQNLKVVNWVLCNWFHELDSSADNLLPNIVTVGPLITSGQPIGSLWSEDLTCLSWLDKQYPGSVIYVAFGSTTKITQSQFEELAFGLELVGQPFLWVVRSDLINGAAVKWPDDFNERVANVGKIVQWAPQEKVLAHPSVACYLTHCGWNSTVESISMGVPMLCWPYFTDQFYNRSCVCYGWKVGLDLTPDENGLITRHELKRKAAKLLSDDGIRSNALNLKELAQKSISVGGSSSKNMQNFIAQLML